MDTSSECPEQETMAGHQMIPPPLPPQPTDHTPEAEPPDGSQSSSDQAAYATAGREVTSAELSRDAGDTAEREVEQMKEGEEAYISTSGRQNEDEGKEQEEETEENGEEEEDGLGNCPQDFSVTGERSGRSSGQSSSSAPPVSKYNTVCYRKIKRGNTKQRIDEFEFMMNV